VVTSKNSYYQRGVKMDIHIHNIKNIEISETRKFGTLNSTFYSRVLSFTDEKGNKNEINLYSDDIRSLNI